ncbi:mannan endo-1,4-beta-mannosidase [Paenibacillus barcinonensis]|uniref:Mannan endo-1,4-beta-mannosidase n=4 Tax=Paenibacillus barcinonensis TaxID=198119 RepID=A0A2V4V8Z7_PAEBA|nr:glycosyl hydrolase [Paenibacillus barcinonensis]PYE49131.1 mannan endo-1,4-beta-mannosidase [Paenibacillus barcinonensis]
MKIGMKTEWRKRVQRTVAMMLTGALLMGTLLLGLLAVTVPATVHADAPLLTIEGEDAELSPELQVVTQIYGQPKPGYSGSGFVWMQGSGTITLNVTVPETGMYSISTRYMQELSMDGRLQYLAVNGMTKGSYMLPYTTTWSDYDFGFHKLNKGNNSIQLKAGWGYAYFDTFTVDYADLDPLNVQPVLSDPESTPETQILMNYLTEVYGHNIISGQQEIYGGGNDGNYELEFEWIHDLTGQYPAIRGFDFMNYNPLYGWEDGTTNRMIDWVNTRGGIATASWHINVPRNFNTYQLGDFVDWKEATYKPTETNFDTAKAVVPGTKEYQYVKLTIADLAEQLQILQDNDVPVIFRPYHEAEGNGGLNGEGAWFWWASAGADVYKKLWDMLYTELTETYDLHNLIWTYNSYVYSTSPAWYPGDEQVDLVGYDKYNTIYNRYDGLSGVPNEDAITSIFYQLVNLTNGKKMVAMTENDTVPSVKNLIEEKAGWLYFCPWYGEHLMSNAFNYPATLKTLYQSDYVITLDELPDLKGNPPNPGAAISPESISFDKAAGAGQDVTIALTLNGHQLTNISKGGVHLVSGQDYIASGATVVFNSSYLSTLPVGQSSLTFHFDGGKAAVLKLNVTDSSAVAPTDAQLTIQAYNGNTSASTSGIAPKFKLINSGDTDIHLSDVKVRYYYTIDGEEAQTFWTDWSSIGSAHVTSTFVKMTSPATGADYYVELGFTSNAGVLNPGGSAEIQARFSKNNWSNYNQADDYSFMASGNQYANHSKVTGYVNNQLVWGMEP